MVRWGKGMRDVVSMCLAGCATHAPYHGGKSLWWRWRSLKYWRDCSFATSLSVRGVSERIRKQKFIANWKFVSVQTRGSLPRTKGSEERAWSALLSSSWTVSSLQSSNRPWKNAPYTNGRCSIRYLYAADEDFDRRSRATKESCSRNTFWYSIIRNILLFWKILDIFYGFRHSRISKTAWRKGNDSFLTTHPQVCNAWWIEKLRRSCKGR